MRPTPCTRFISSTVFPSLILLSASLASADSGTWNPTPGNGFWNTPSNWSGGTTPNDETHTATFGASTVIDLLLSANTTVSSITFNAGAPIYTIRIDGPDENGHLLTLTGLGIIS